MFQGDERPPVGVAAPPVTAGLVRRISARLVDGIAAILLAIVGGVALIVATFTFGSDLGIQDSTLATLGDIVLLLVLLVVLFGPFVAALLVGIVSGLLGKGTGTTPGRRMLGLRVVDADDGEPTRGRAALHGLLRHLPTLLLALGLWPVFFDGDAIIALAVIGGALLLADVVSVLARRDDRALHDVLAGVTVVRRAKGAAA